VDSSSAKLLVLVGKRFACIKITGRVNFNSSIDFRMLADRLQALDFPYFVIDLSECVLMDSTFLGVLAGFGLRMRPSGENTTTASVTLLNPSARVTELLENLGLLELFRITRGELAPPETLEAYAPDPIHASREELTRACLEAHETLMAINPENAARFKDVAMFLAEDLAKLRK
jgi:anti-sigma B factor antagonist